MLSAYYFVLSLPQAPSRFRLQSLHLYWREGTVTSYGNQRLHMCLRTQGQELSQGSVFRKTIPGSCVGGVRRSEHGGGLKSGLGQGFLAIFKHKTTDVFCQYSLNYVFLHFLASFVLYQLIPLPLQKRETVLAHNMYIILCSLCHCVKSLCSMHRNGIIIHFKSHLQKVLFIHSD